MHILRKVHVTLTDCSFLVLSSSICRCCALSRSSVVLPSPLFFPSFIKKQTNKALVHFDLWLSTCSATTIHQMCKLKMWGGKFQFYKLESTQLISEIRCWIIKKKSSTNWPALISRQLCRVLIKMKTLFSYHSWTGRLKVCLSSSHQLYNSFSVTLFEKMWIRLRATSLGVWKIAIFIKQKRKTCICYAIITLNRTDWKLHLFIKSFLQTGREEQQVKNYCSAWRNDAMTPADRTGNEFSWWES